jgi:SAM-dependent methyltransferase
MAVQQSGFWTETLYFASKLGEVTREKGLGHVVSFGAHWITSPLLAPLYRRTRAGWAFRYDKRSLPYFWHRYNTTWRNERAIEIPIAWEAVQSARGGRILEVGNVLSHYYAFEHDVLDKYEKRPGVVNQDVVDFKPATAYDLIVSISTLEHVGWDEQPRDASKIPQAISAMSSWLAPGGTLLVTVPIGYNDHLDEHFRRGSVKFDEQHYLVRETSDNCWREASWEEVAHGKYGVPFRGSSCHMVIGINRAPG